MFLDSFQKLTTYLSRTFKPGPHGDPTAFFADIQLGLRLASCDQLLILDCAYSAQAFAAEETGRRRFELLTSTSHNGTCLLPGKEGSFTGILINSIKRLLKDYPDGFCTSRLYREIYHATKPPQSRPMLFDESCHDYGKIWLRPQKSQMERKPAEERFSLNLTFTIDTRPDLATMNDLAMSLRFLPHVDRIRFEKLYSPRDRLVNFVQFVIYAQRFLRAMIRKRQVRF